MFLINIIKIHSSQTSLLLSPIDGLASFLKTTLANGIKVVKKVKTSKFRFHLIAIYALGCFRNFSCTPVPTKITLKSPLPPSPNTSERMNFNDIDFKVILVGTGVQLKLRKHPNAYIAIK
jgi:hypothetical protein